MIQKFLQPFSAGRGVSACVFLPLLSVAVLASAQARAAETRQDMVHHRSHEVMPFAMADTLHIFRMTETGGVQQVVLREGAPRDPLGMIRQHLQHEAMMFQHGNYADPMHLHGAGMPGLAELSAAGEAVQVRYAELPDGAELRFEAQDIRHITAIHRWFGAQLSEHGADARAE